MAVLERSDLEASPLADLHAIADQIGLDGFRRLRKADLIDLILGDSSPDASSRADVEEAAAPGGEGARERSQRTRRRRPRRSERPAEDRPGEDEEPRAAVADDGRETTAGSDGDGLRARRSRTRGSRSRESGREEEDAGAGDGRIAEGVVEVLGNGSAFLRIDPPEPSDEDVYISAAQVRRCELVSGDRVCGPVRTPRRSERYPSLVRIDTINGGDAASVPDGARYEDLPVTWPSERLALDSQDVTLRAIEWLTPIGLGSRVILVGGRGAGKSRTLRHLLDAVGSRQDLEVTLVLAGCRPEEVGEWQEGPVAPLVAAGLAASPEAQGQAVERAVDAAKRVAARGGNALVLIDSLDGMAPPAARRVLAAARNLREGGSLTLLATASRPLGGETTVIALDAALAAAGREPTLDLGASGTLRAELLVGEEGAAAITRARASAFEARD